MNIFAGIVINCDEYFVGFMNFKSELKLLKLLELSYGFEDTAAVISEETS